MNFFSILLQSMGMCQCFASVIESSSLLWLITAFLILSPSLVHQLAYLQCLDNQPMLYFFHTYKLCPGLFTYTCTWLGVSVLVCVYVYLHITSQSVHFCVHKNFSIYNAWNLARNVPCPLVSMHTYPWLWSHDMNRLSITSLWRTWGRCACGSQTLFCHVDMFFGLW